MITRHVLIACLLVTLTLCAPARARADLLVSTYTSDVVLRYDDVTGAFLGVFASGGGLGGPSGLAYGPDGNLYVASEDTWEILRYNGRTGAFIDVFVPRNSGGLVEPEGIMFAPNGNLLVSTLASVLEYHGTTGAFLRVFARNEAGDKKFSHPEGIQFGPHDGLFYATSSDNDRVLRFHPVTGAFIDIFVPPGSGGLDDAQGLTFGPDGNLYVSSLATNAVIRYDGHTGALLGTFASGSGLLGPEGIAFGPDGNLYVSGRYSDKIFKFNGVTGAFIDVFDEAFDANGKRLLKLPTYNTFTPFTLRLPSTAPEVVPRVPEPSTLIVLGGGLVVWLGVARRTRAARRPSSP